MSRISSFFTGIIVGAVGLYLVMQFYFIRSNDGFHLVPKMAAKLEMPYIDIRKFTLNDWQSHQSLAVAILKANRGNLMQDSSLGSIKQAAQRTLEQITGNKSSVGW
jgi:hypothetical protein